MPPLLQPVGYQATIRGVGQYLSQSSAIVGANQKVVASIGKGLTAVGGNLTKFVTLPLLAVGAVSVLAFSNFNKAMTESIAIMGELSGPTRDKMVQAARDVAKETTFSHKEAAESYFFLASAGLTAEQSIGALPFVSKFAQAGAFDMALATDLLTDAQSALGLTVDDTAQNLENMTRVGDIFVRMNTEANATVQQFSEAITEQAGTALAVNNIALEEGVAVLALWADAGLKGTQAGTNFASLLTLLPKIADKNKDAFAAYGVEIFDASGKMKNFADIADEFTPLLTQLTDEERAAAFGALGINKRLVTSIGLFKNAGDKIREYEANARDAGGTTEEVAEKQLKSMSAQFSLLKSKAEDVAITLGAALAPAVFQIAKGLDKFIAGLDAVVQEFLAWPKPVQKIVGVTLIFAALLGPMLILLGLVIGAFVNLIALAPVVAGAWAIMTGPMLPFILAAAAVVAITILVWKNWDTLSRWADTAKEKVSGFAMSMIRNWKTVLPIILAALGPIGLLAAAGILIATNWDEVIAVLDRVGTSIEDFAESMERRFFSALETVQKFVGKTIDVLLFLPRKAKAFGEAIPDALRFGLITTANVFLQTLANFVNRAIRIIDPFGWVFSPENMPEIFAKIGDEAGLALVNSMLDSLGDFGVVLDSAIAEPLRNVRSFIADLQSELTRLLNLPSVESAAEGLALAQLALREFGLEAGAEEDALARADRIEKLREEIEALTDAREDERESLQDEKKALEEERAAIFGTGAARTEERVAREQALQREIDGIDKQIDAIADGTDATSKQIEAIERQIEATEKSRTQRERELESIRDQITKLKLLGDARRLERDILAERGLTADKTLITDNQIIAAANIMIDRIGVATEAFSEQAQFINTTYIPSLLLVRDTLEDRLAAALDETGDGLGDLTDGDIPDLTDALGDISDELGKTGEDFSVELEIPGKAAIGRLLSKVWGFKDELAIWASGINPVLAFVNDDFRQFAVDVGISMFDAGKAIAEGLLKGIKAVATDPVGVANSIANAIIGVINNIIDFVNRKLEFEIGAGPFTFNVDPKDIKHIPTFAGGGRLAAGELGIVGERGPELFVPQSAGQVVPMGGISPLLAALSGMPGGGESNSFKNYGTLTLAADRGQGADMIRTLIRSMT